MDRLISRDNDFPSRKEWVKKKEAATPQIKDVEWNFRR